MRFSATSLCLPLLHSVLASAFISHKLDHREAFELIEREDSASDNAWIVPANVTVDDWDTAEPGEGWIPADEYLRRKGIAPLGAVEDSSSFEEVIEPLPLPPSTSALVSKRAGGTRVNIGRKQTDYGCGASIRTPIGEALNLICSNGFCDQSITYVRTVDWLDNG
jgi:hypothetical protein